MKLIKAHAYGNDFLLVSQADIPAGADRSALARAICDRHGGVGADGLIEYQTLDAGASMRLLNADGSRSELSGNGVRCLAAWIAQTARLEEGASLAIQTDAGEKRLDLIERRGTRLTFRAAMGQPEDVRRCALDVDGEAVDVVTLRVGNPQCVVLGGATPDRLRTIGAGLAVHPHFPEGTNVELVALESPGSIRILIWERGVGPTEASGTGACAAAVAAIQYAGASRDLAVASPGGVQRVEWREDGLYLMGWAEVVAEIRWLRDQG